MASKSASHATKKSLARKKTVSSAKKPLPAKKSVKSTHKAAAAIRKVASKAKTNSSAKKAASKKPLPKQKATKTMAKPAAKAMKKPAVKATAKAPVKPAAKPQAKPAAKVLAKITPQTAVKSAAKPVAAKTAAPKATTPKDYKIGMYVVYPTHGVGKIVSEETQQIAGMSLTLLVISFEKDKMTLRVPKHRATAAGLRHISSDEQIERAFTTLKSRARTSRGMWSRRAQEYEAKINSGNLLQIAEVVRDLHQNVDQAERSYSERMIYESAFGRLVGELAAAEAIDHTTASEKLVRMLRAKMAA